MDAVSINKSLSIESYFKEYAFHPLSDELTTTEKVITLAITVFATIFTAGLFAVGVAAYQFCILPTFAQVENDPKIPDKPHDTSTAEIEEIVDDVDKPVELEYTFTQYATGKTVKVKLMTPFDLVKTKEAIATAMHIDSSLAPHIQIFARGSLVADAEKATRVGTLTTIRFALGDEKNPASIKLTVGQNGSSTTSSLDVEVPVTIQGIQKAIAAAHGLDAKLAKDISLFIGANPLIDKTDEKGQKIPFEGRGLGEDIRITYILPRVAKADDVDKYKFRIGSEEIALAVTTPTLAAMQIAIAQARGIDPAQATKIRLAIRGQLYSTADAIKADAAIADLPKDNRIMVVLPPTASPESAAPTLRATTTREQ